MKCPTCGGEMALSETVCPQCHDPRPQWAPVFEETARRFADLKARFQAGQLDAASYEAALHKLMIEHEGTFWTLGAEMEVCHVMALQVRNGGGLSLWGYCCERGVDR